MCLALEGAEERPSIGCGKKDGAIREAPRHNQTRPSLKLTHGERRRLKVGDQRDDSVVGLHQVTFFRYFPCKEDVVTAIARLSMDDSIGHLSEHEPSEPIGRVLRATMTASLSRVYEDPDAARAFQVMLRDTPTLRGRWLEEQRRNRDRLAEAILPWFPQDGRPLVRRLVAGTALLAVEEVMARWADDSINRNVVELLDEAFDLLDSSPFLAGTPLSKAPV